MLESVAQGLLVHVVSSLLFRMDSPHVIIAARAWYLCKHSEDKDVGLDLKTATGCWRGKVAFTLFR